METTVLDAVRCLIDHVGEEPERKGLQRTPHRVAKMLSEVTVGYQLNEASLFDGALYPSPDTGLVRVEGIEFYSLCEHHLVPFFGTCDIAYLPDEHIVGLSKLGRVVDMYSKRLQVQERLTNQIIDCLERHIKPKAVRVTMRARHLCMAMRGVQKPDAMMTTQAMRGDIGEMKRYD